MSFVSLVFSPPQFSSLSSIALMLFDIFLHALSSSQPKTCENLKRSNMNCVIVPLLHNPDNDENAPGNPFVSMNRHGSEYNVLDDVNNVGLDKI